MLIIVGGVLQRQYILHVCNGNSAGNVGATRNTSVRCMLSCV